MPRARPSTLSARSLRRLPLAALVVGATLLAAPVVLDAAADAAPHAKAPNARATERGKPTQAGPATTTGAISPTSTTTTTTPSTSTTTTTTTTTTRTTATTTATHSTTTSTAPAHPDGTTTGAKGALVRRVGDLTITTAGTVLQDLDIVGSVLVAADAVTLRNVRVTSTDYWPIRLTGAGAVLEHVTVVGTTKAQAGVGDSGRSTLRALDISGTQDGVKLGSHSVLSDSFIHDLGTGAGIHNDGVEVNGPVGARIIHNTVLNAQGQTSAIFIGGKNTPCQDIVVQGNLLAGGGYTIYGPVGRSGVPPSSDVRVVDNVISTRYFPRGGFYGPLAYWEEGVGNVWSGNTWADGPAAGVAVSAG